MCTSSELINKFHRDTPVPQNNCPRTKDQNHTITHPRALSRHPRPGRGAEPVPDGPRAAAERVDGRRALEPVDQVAAAAHSVDLVDELGILTMMMARRLRRAGRGAQRAGLAAEQAGVAALVAAGVDEPALLALVEGHLAGRADRAAPAAVQAARRLNQRPDLRQV